MHGECILCFRITYRSNDSIKVLGKRDWVSTARIVTLGRGRCRKPRGARTGFAMRRLAMSDVWRRWQPRTTAFRGQEVQIALPSAC